VEVPKEVESIPLRRVSQLLLVIGIDAYGEEGKVIAIECGGMAVHLAKHLGTDLILASAEQAQHDPAARHGIEMKLGVKWRAHHEPWSRFPHLKTNLGHGNGLRLVAAREWGIAREVRQRP